MEFDQSEVGLVIKTTDMHTAGEPLRIVETGYPKLNGSTLLDKRKYAKENVDDLRKFLMNEPRGHSDMYGAILLEPVDPKADLSVLFIQNEGYSTMCGHAVIGLGKYAVDRQLVKKTSSAPETKVIIECPCGLVTAYVDNLTRRVRFQSVPAFVHTLDATVQVENFGPLRIDIVYGGAFYVIIDVTSIGMDFTRTPLSILTDFADKIKAAAKAQVSLHHPISSELAFLYGTIITDGKDSETSSTNICIFADKEIDRSPTGSGVTARIALQHKKKLISLHQEKSFQSLIGTKFTGKATEETKCGEFDAVIVEVSGMAYYTGKNTFVLEKDDPLPTGFQLRK